MIAVEIAAFVGGLVLVNTARSPRLAAFGEIVSLLGLGAALLTLIGWIVATVL
jgi:hypothetical protein